MLMNKKDKKKLKPLFKHQFAITAICICAVVVATLSTSYAIFSKTKEGDEYNVIKVGELDLSYVDIDDEGNVLQLVSEYPITDKEGTEGNSYRFSVENTGTLNLKYKVRIVDDNATITADGCSDNLVDKKYIKYKFNNDNVKVLNDSVGYTYDENNEISETYYEVYSGSLTPYESDIHEIRIWLSDTSPNSVLGQHYHGKVVIEIEQDGGNTGAIEKNFAGAILKENTLITSEPTLTSTSEETNENGLYVSYATNSGKPTYYFRGNVQNNYVEFANQLWRIVRINEDGTIRLIMEDGINNNTTYAFNSQSGNYEYMYYSKSEIKPILEQWYKDNLNDFDSKISTSEYCEQAIVSGDSVFTANNQQLTLFDSYVPDFMCKNDANGYGIVNAKIGMLTFEEAIYSGVNFGKTFQNVWLVNSNKNNFSTMSPAGFDLSNGNIWGVISGEKQYYSVNDLRVIRPVISLNSNVVVTGSGTSTDHYIVK